MEHIDQGGAGVPSPGFRFGPGGGGWGPGRGLSLAGLFSGGPLFWTPRLCQGLHHLPCSQFALVPGGISGSAWHRKLEVLDRQTLADGNIYFRIAERNYNPKDNDTYKEYWVRSTDTQIYLQSAATLNNPVIYLKAEPPGGVWSFPAFWDGESGTQYNQVVSVESVTVPYGNFTTSYLNGHQFEYYCVWGDWIVPSNGVFTGGIVKTLDYCVATSNNDWVEHALARVIKPGGKIAPILHLLLD